MSWTHFETAAPALAAEGRRLLSRAEAGGALLATVRDDLAPRIHPIDVSIVDGRLFAFILSGPKRTDLERDGRYAMHTHLDPAAPNEFAVRGHAHLVTDPTVRATVAAGWSFEPDDAFGLLEFDVESALLGVRGADEWPPTYTRWRAASEA